jgi:hypothetical protein
MISSDIAVAPDVFRNEVRKSRWQGHRRCRVHGDTVSTAANVRGVAKLAPSAWMGHQLLSRLAPCGVAYICDRGRPGIDHEQCRSGAAVSIEIGMMSPSASIKARTTTSQCYVCGITLATKTTTKFGLL